MSEPIEIQVTDFALVIDAWVVWLIAGLLIAWTALSAVGAWLSWKKLGLQRQIAKYKGGLPS